LTSWFKANSGNIAYTPASGNKVALWTSELGNLSLVQATSSKQPFFRPVPKDSANFNFNPFVQFYKASATGLAAAATSPDLMGTAGTVFMVTNKGNTSTAFTYSVNYYYRWQVKPGFRAQIGNNGYGWTSDFVSGVVPVSAPDSSGYILTTRGTGAGFRGRYNGDSLALTNTNNTTYNPAILTSGLYVGWNGSNELFDGSVAEIITFNTTLADADVNKVESYLAVKYGITLSQQPAFGIGTNANYTAANGTIFWDAAANAGYGKCITGIARDDSSALLQKQSVSVHDSALVYLYNGAVGGVFPDANATNTSVIASDKSFLLVGDNGLTRRFSSCAAGSPVMIMPRIWKVQKTGSGITTVTIALDTSRVQNIIKRLIVSANPSFPAGATTSYPLSAAGKKLYASLTLNNNDYFTFTTDTVRAPVVAADSVCPGGTSRLVIQNADPSYTYYWYGAPAGGSKLDSGAVYTTPAVTPPASYYVSATSGTCVSSPGVVPIPPFAALPAPVISITARSENSLSFAWPPVAGATGYLVSVDGGTYITPSSGSTGTTHTVTGLSPTQTIIFSVIAQGAPGCKTSSAAKVSARALATNVFIPGAFTPNGDGTNDVFKVYSNLISTMDMKIFNQWGELIFSTSNPGDGWDGTYKGRKQPAGVYIYAIRIKLVDGTDMMRKGSLTLIH
ncbi:MAG: gliding motility-associated C-terminal domain-containing protein, partial [Bacteroidetes bacterium]|nr:gliding motility-associated C-terminal domain-containing protein [Bacteroidota bacterium]